MPRYTDSLVLYAACNVSPNSEALPNTAALKNPYDLPMEIREIRFRIYPLTTQFASTASVDVDPFEFRRVTGQSLGVKMDLADVTIVDAQVPISSFGTQRDCADFSGVNGVFANSGINPPGVVNQLAVYTSEAGLTFAAPVSYSWRLKYPMYVPPGGVLVPTFEHLGQTHLSLHVDVIYVCNSLPASYKPPAKLMYPWVGSYSSKSFDNFTATAAGRDQSTELDLLNPFSVPLEVSRLVGGLGLTFNSANSIGDAIEDFGDHRMRLGTVKARSSQGDELARSPTRFAGLFPTTWRAWDIPHGWIMAPYDYYRLALSVDAVDYNTTDSVQGRDQYMVALTGYRALDAVAVLPATGGAQ